MNPVQILAIAIFVIVYILIMMDKLDRAVVSMAGGILMLMVLLGSDIITKEANVFDIIDFKTIATLVSMMAMVLIIKQTGVFSAFAIAIVKLGRGNPIVIMILLSLATGFLSAFFDNVTTMLLTIPITIFISKELLVSPIPFVVSQVFASNVGGTATLIGDPPNIMIADKADFGFVDVASVNAPIALIILVITTLLFALKFRKSLHVLPEYKESLKYLSPLSHITDMRLLVKSGIVMGLTVLGFFLEKFVELETYMIAMTGAVLMCLITFSNSHVILKDIEWKTIFFFMGLFLLVGGLEKTKVIDFLATKLLAVTNGNIMLMTISVLWVSAIASAFIDNIPFVATMIPLLLDIQNNSSTPITAVWFALSLGACLGGNGTIIGASANVIGFGYLETEGYKVSFGKYFKFAFPLMIITIAFAMGYLLLKYFT